jgi:hypothetical protein
VNPDADETCNAVDDDCDGQIDEADAVNATTWYFDADGDQFGDASKDVRGVHAPGWLRRGAGRLRDLDPSAQPGRRGSVRRRRSGL